MTCITYTQISLKVGKRNVQEFLHYSQINRSEWIFIISIFFIFFFNFLHAYLLMYSKNDLCCFIWALLLHILVSFQLNLWEEHFACYSKLMPPLHRRLFFHSFVLGCGSATVFLKECLVLILWVSLVFKPQGMWFPANTSFIHKHTIQQFNVILDF